MSVVDCVDVGRTYGSGETAVEAVRSVTFAVERGEVVAIEGPSGCGKTTLLGLMAGLELPDRGSICILGHQLDRLSAAERARLRRSQIGIVFQTFGLVASLTARENVALPLRLDGLSVPESSARADEALEHVGVDRSAAARPDELSGGERQRVAIARAIAARPALLLADEPTGSLDERQGRAIVDLLVRHSREARTATVLVTHDPVSAIRADRRMAMRDGQLSAATP
jgi:putative ABC transport system ATP-binding protein